MNIFVGPIVSTRGVVDGFENAFINECLSRHARGDWGDVPEEDRKLNDAEHSLEGGRVLSVYHKDQQKLWIITEAIATEDQVTTLLLPSEY